MEAREARDGGFDEDVFVLDYDVDNEAALLILLIQDRRQQTDSEYDFLRLRCVPSLYCST